mgnify:CR=1 FL=1
MTRKGRSKVRAQEPTSAGCVEPGSVVHPDLLDFDLRRPFAEWPESVRAQVEANRAEGSAEQLQISDETELTPDELVAAIDAIDSTAPPARNTLTDYLPALPAPVIEDAPADENHSAYLSALRQEMDDRKEYAEGKLAAALAPDLALVLGELWTVRLAKMADLAGQSPNQYLQTLLARAWTAMPRRSRENSP